MTHLDELPVELIVQVFEHIPSRDLWSNVRLKLDVALPQCQVEQQDFHLAECCCAIEDEMGRWASDRLQRYVSVTGHLGTVDAIRLLETSAHKRLCITGSRDRSLIVWDVNKIAVRFS
ncbi:unnamed protein product [Toxocara canis]|uniref:WD_REPEATS_REGION domain-containing protein n=1 Tax=Toxocara canis TaxID=6265 RepID=A0A183UEZ6_TOXCA|nr:unnamed protein product [Toxocara canis]